MLELPCLSPDSPIHCSLACYPTQEEERPALPAEAVLACQAVMEERDRAGAWVRTADRLPADSAPVLICVRNPVGCYFLWIADWIDAEWIEGHWLDDAGNRWEARDVLAWMPLPSFPAEVGEEAGNG